MRIVVALDSFKGSLTSLEAGTAVKEAILQAYPAADVGVFPVADGGEGTVAALTAGCGGKQTVLTVTGPLGEPITAGYGILPDGTAVLEMAAAAGLPLVPESRRNPLHTTTFGVGEMIRDAIERGCRSFLIGIGGSATNDGGTGMLRALGFRFLDQKGEPVANGAIGLRDLAAIDTEGAMPALAECTFRIACDVTNPLCGPRGCSAVFAPQKGADAQSIPRMDRWLRHYADLVGMDPDTPGAGAAGGLGYAFLSFLGGRLEPGVQIVLGLIGIESAIREADIVITGEGRLDGQSVMGKAPVGIAALAKKYYKPVIALCGCIGEGAEACKAWGIDEYFAITPADMPSAEAMKPEIARKNLKNTILRVLHPEKKGYVYENH